MAIAARSASPSAFADVRQLPSSPTKAQTSPPAPKRRTTSVSWSSSERGASRGPALSPRTTPPDSSTPEKTRNSVPATASPRSAISSPKRRSGLSEPKRSIASS